MARLLSDRPLFCGGSLNKTYCSDEETHITLKARNDPDDRIGPGGN